MKILSVLIFQSKEVVAIKGQINVKKMKFLHYSEYFAIIILVLQIISQTKCDLVCLACPDSPTARDCPYITKCGQQESCYLDSYVTRAGAVIHDTGCRDTAMCSSSLGKRSTNETIDKRSTANKLVCSECCQGDLCNSALCGQPGYPTVSGSRGPLCYNCDQQQYPDSCSVIKECGRNEVCSLMISKSSVVTSDVLYTTRCESKLVCDAELQYIRPGAGIVGKKRYSGQVTSSTGHRCLGKCCDSDLCNFDCTNTACKNPAYTLVTGTNVCLRVGKLNLTYADARHSCKQDGGDLVIVKSQDIFDGVTQLLANAGTSHYWVGMERDAHLATGFSWVDGTSLTNTNGGQFWQPGQPNNLNNAQDCVFLMKLADDHLYLADYYCGTHEFFICEMQL